MPFDSDEDKLAFDVERALKRSPHIMKFHAGKSPVRLVARGIVEHLKRSRWVFRRRRPRDLPPAKGPVDC